MNPLAQAGGPPRELKELETIFENLLKAILPLAGIVLFIFITIGGFKFITAGGDPKKAESAKNTLTYAIGGLIFLLLAYLILKLINTITGAPVTQFQISP